MGFEPTIIVYKPDLLDNKKFIEDWKYKKRPSTLTQSFLNKQNAYSTLEDVLNMGGFKIQGHEMILFTPEGTRHNEAVRNLLRELNIEFAIDC